MRRSIDVYKRQLLGKAFIRLRTAVMNPFQRVVRRIQQLFNANIITSKLVAPINAKVRKILSGEAKSPEDYFTVGRTVSYTHLDRRSFYLLPHRRSRTGSE